MVRTRLTSSGLSTGGSLWGSLMCQTSAARSWRRSVTRNKNRTPVMIRLRLQRWRTKILRAADAFYARRREGPYRFIQNRSRTSVVALKSDAAAEKSKDQLSLRFSGSLDFRLLQQYLPQADAGGMVQA